MVQKSQLNCLLVQPTWNDGSTYISIPADGSTNMRYCWCWLNLQKMLVQPALWKGNIGWTIMSWCWTSIFWRFNQHQYWLNLQKMLVQPALWKGNIGWTIISWCWTSIFWRFNQHHCWLNLQKMLVEPVFI